MSPPPTVRSGPVRGGPCTRPGGETQPSTVSRAGCPTPGYVTVLSPHSCTEGRAFRPPVIALSRDDRSAAHFPIQVVQGSATLWLRRHDAVECNQLGVERSVGRMFRGGGVSQPSVMRQRSMTATVRVSREPR